MTDGEHRGPLRLSPDELASCVSCGLCLSHCPTFRVTGDELLSPRGRVAAMREVELHGAPVDDTFLVAMDTCLQCRGCETACPSGVPFGHLMEDVRAAVVDDGRRPPWWLRLGLRALGHHRLVVAGARLAAVGQRLGVVPSSRLGLPRRLPLRVAPLRPSGDDVWLFTGCVMDAVQRDVHVAVQRVIEATGAGVAIVGPGGDCCGALHVHAGMRSEAERLARRVMAAIGGDAPILVDSAGCGAAMKDYGRLLGTPEAERFSARVLDVHEWLASRLHLLAPVPAERPRPKVAVQDPCHLRHVQRSHEAVRSVLAPWFEVVELDDDGLCCGAGGSYSFLHPGLAGDIRDRKLAAIGTTGATVVASANPGCVMHLAAGGIEVRHPLQLVAEALD